MKTPNINKFTELSGVTPSENALREEKTLQFWSENNIFEKTLEKESPAGDFHFFEGPPTSNGRPGIHHVAARGFKDLIPRYKTMRGFRVHRKAGWDTHGLPVELQVEKELGLTSKKQIEEYGVALFNQKCRESVWTYKDEWEAVTARMGYWLDMENPYITYKNDYIEGVWSVIKKISQRTTNGVLDLLYRDFKILPWCSRCGTGLSSHELNQPGAYQDVKDVTAYVKFPIIGFPNAYFLAWTTTPWTLPGNIALAVGADIVYVEIKVGNEILVLAKSLLSKIETDYEIIAEHTGSEMVGMKYEPLYLFMSDLMTADQREKLGNAFTVYAADFVTTTDGTGIVHIAPMYGQDDFELATKNNLPKFHVVNEEGKYIAGCDTDTLKLSGRYVKELDDAGKPTLAIDIINDLTARNLLWKKENYVHSYPHCWRCNTPLLYYARASWYFRMSALREQLLSANEKINWEPEHIKSGRFGEWLDGIRDWAVSRERYWGTPLPIWENTDKSKRVVIGGLEDIKKYSKKSGNKYFVMRHGHGTHMVEGVYTYKDDNTHHLTEQGINEVKLSAESLRNQGITKIISSPALRCKQTAELTAEVLGFDKDTIVINNNFEEFNFGIYSNKLKIEFDTFFGGWDYKPDYMDKKAPEGESLWELKKRVGDGWSELEQNFSNENILIVTHHADFEAMKQVELLADKTESQNISVPMDIKTAEIREYFYPNLPHNENYELDFHKPYIDALELIDPETGEPLKRTSEIIDVWFDSGAMPYAQSHTLGGSMDWEPVPADYIAEGADQTRGWFYTMHAIANLLNDKPTNNYNNVTCLGLLMAADGTKMSKSKGNIVSPWEVFAKFGADVARFWFYSVNGPGETKNYDEKSLDEVNKKVFNPLRNVVSFYEMYKPDELPFINPFDSTNVLDQWILANLQNLSQTLVSNLDTYRVLEPARAIREFINELSTWYVRRSRDRFKSDNTTDRDFALVTLQFVLDNLARYMAPFTPFVAEEIYQQVRIEKFQESVHLETWHTWTDKSRFIDTLEPMQTVRDIVTLGLEARQKSDIKVRQPLQKISISSNNLSVDYLEIVKDELNVKQVTIDETLSADQVILDTEITPELRDEGDMRDIIRKVQDMRKTADLVPTDTVTVTLDMTEPEWFGTNTVLHDELMNTVGAKQIVWNGGADKVERV